MRRITTLSLAVAGLFVLTYAAVAQANWYQHSESSGGSTSEMTSPSDDPGTSAPEVGTYERQEATEAGKLPPGEKSMSSGGEFRSDENVPTYEVGGRTYRAGIDDGP